MDSFCAKKKQQRTKSGSGEKETKTTIWEQSIDSNAEEQRVRKGKIEDRTTAIALLRKLVEEIGRLDEKISKSTKNVLKGLNG